MQNEDGTSSNTVRSPRFTHWIALFVFSTIVLGSSVTSVSNIEEIEIRFHGINFCVRFVSVTTAKTFTDGMHLNLINPHSDTGQAQ